MAGKIAPSPSSPLRRSIVKATALSMARRRDPFGNSGSTFCNTASMAGLLNAPNMGVYNVSKHAVVSLTETLFQDLALVDAPIGASVLCPYFVPTRR